MTVTRRAIVIALILAAAATVLYATRRGTAPRYLARDEIGVDWPFYAAMNRREDLVPDTHYYSPDDIDKVTAPVHSLLVAPAVGIPSEGSLIAHGWSAVKTVTEAGGQPTFVIYEKK